MFNPTPSLGLECFADADFAGNWNQADADDNSNHLKPLYRGRVENARGIFEKVLASDGDQVVVTDPCYNLTRDDSAWSAMKKVAPKYTLYDALPNEEQPPLPFDLENILLDLEF